jgi:alkanesulfonate monooxygenase SsuD/methylene tetrahydromethanopterin reductase-like flavin-dependent oxidoreductase (luciferase family)
MSPVELAREAEARGFHSLYVPEHTHIPTSRRTPPPTGDAELAEEYLRSLDPYVALAAAASVTSRIRLGTGVALVAQHDPIALAKEIATVDLLSGGRFVLGIGYGWKREEMENQAST